MYLCSPRAAGDPTKTEICMTVCSACFWATFWDRLGIFSASVGSSCGLLVHLGASSWLIFTLLGHFRAPNPPQSAPKGSQMPKMTSKTSPQSTQNETKLNKMWASFVSISASVPSPFLQLSSALRLRACFPQGARRDSRSAGSISLEMSMR